MTTDEFIDDVRQRYAGRGGQAAIAKYAGVTSSYVSQVMNGKQAPSDRFCGKLGYQKVTMFKPL